MINGRKSERLEHFDNPESALAIWGRRAKR
jgi:hypothetical protein